jgi:carbamoyltransferase
MIVLGIHKDPWHDTGAAIILDNSNGFEICMISEERLDRVKDSRAFPSKAINQCLNFAGDINIEDVDLVVLDYIRTRDWQKDEFSHPCEINTILERIDPQRIVVINHHHAHACSTFYSSPFDEAAILVVDGRGSDNETQSLFIGDAQGIHLVDSTDCIGIGLLYACTTQAIGFGLLQEGKTMGLAPYGAEVETENVEKYRFNGYFDGIKTDYSALCVEGKYELDPGYPLLDTPDKKARAAFEVQAECERALLYLARYAREKTGKRRLCISGGVGLNSVGNNVILQAGIFDDVFINPACSDTGIPLGAAMHGYHELLQRPKSPVGLPSPFIGPLHAHSSHARAAQKAVDLGCQLIEGSSALEKAIQLLIKNRIVAVCHGRSEMGPRALGNRSILMSPLKAQHKDILNARVKHREAFRPFAPITLDEYYNEWFIIDRPSPFMLFVPQVRPEKRKIIPAVTHVDGTGRLQTLSTESPTITRRLIEGFHRGTGVPVLLNTSFNVNGKPIVESPDDAVQCFLSTNIDALLLEGFLLIKSGVDSTGTGSSG